MAHLQRLFALILCVLLILPACAHPSGEQPEDAAASNQPVTPEASASEAETEAEQFVADYLPEADYDGYAYTIVCYTEYPKDVNEPSGDLIKDSIYRRNLLIEDRYNITFETVEYPFNEYPEVTALMKNAATAQSDDFDLCVMVVKAAYEAVLSRYARTADQIPYADLTQPWYYQTLNDKFTFSGIPLMGINAFDLNPGGSSVIFNKNLVDILSLPSPYTLVDEGGWTVDRMYEMMDAAAADLDGDGKMTMSDRFGFIGEPDSMTLLMYAGSGLTLVKEEDGSLVIAEDEALIDLLLKYLRGTEKAGTYFDTFNEIAWEENSRIKGNDFFKAGGALFLGRSTDALTSFGDMEDDYGIVPYPKKDEGQKEYYVPSGGGNPAMTLSCETDPERVGVIREALAVESLNICHPAYYENAVKNRYIRDTDSLRMLEIITAHPVFDYGNVIWWDTIRAPWMDCVQNRSEDIASAMKKTRKMGEKAIEKLMKMVDELKDAGD